MRKITFLLALMLSFCGIASAQTVITSVDALSNSKVYTLTNSRGTWAVDDAGTALANAGSSADASDTKNQFGIYKATDGNYYLYSVSANTFVLNAGSFGASLSSPLKLYTNSNNSNITSGCFLLQLGSNYMNFGGSNQVVLNSYDTPDAGNITTITEVGDLDETLPAAVYTAAVLPASKAQLEVLVTQANTCLTYNVGYSGNSTLETAIADNTGADDDTYETVLTKIANLTTAIAAYNEGAPNKVFSTADGLPGTSDGTCYTWNSGTLNFSNSISTLRYTVLETNTGGNLGSYPYFSLSGMNVFDGEGNEMSLTSDNFTSNALQDNDGDGYAALVDDDVTTYFHSMWNTWYDSDPNAYHYIEVSLPSDVSSLSLQTISRNNRANTPTLIVISGLGAAVDLTYNIYVDGVFYKSKTVSSNFGSVVPEISEDYVTITSYSPVVGSIITEAMTITVEGTANLPFTTSTSADATDATWYMIDMHSNDSGTEDVSNGTHQYIWKYLEGESDNVQLPMLSVSNTEYGDNYLWCFVGNLVDGFKIYNKAAGSAYALTKAEDSNSAANLAEGDGTLFNLVKSTQITDATCFRPVGHSNFVNTQAVDGVKVLRGWTLADGGSSCRFHAPTEYMLNYAATVSAGVAPANALGANVYFDTTDKVTAFNNAVAAAETSPYSLEAAAQLAAIAKEVEAAGTNSSEITEGGYYRFISALPDFNLEKGLLYVEGQAKLQWGSVDNSTVNGIFQITTNTADATKYVIKNCNHEQYLAGAGAAFSETEPINGNSSNGSGVMTFTSLGGGQFNLTFGNGILTAQNTSSATSGVAGGTGGLNTASAWFIVPATELEVALNTVDDASYATAYLPFPVSGCDATMWTAGSITSEALMMEEQTAIPEKTGVVLVSDAAASKATLTIGGEATFSGTNYLTGSLETVSDPSSYLVLGIGNVSGTIGFYPPSANLTSIGANKAFLNASEVPSSALALNFGGNATAIESAIADKAADNAPIYDLSGRAVLKTVKGNLYIQSGKKFIAK